MKNKHLKLLLEEAWQRDWVPTFLDTFAKVAINLEKLATKEQPLETSRNEAMILRGAELADELREDWPLNLVPFLSTRHMREEDDQALRDLSDTHGDYVSVCEGGWVIYLGGHNFDNEVWAERVTPELFRILDTAAMQGANYIRFDQDGPELIRFPTFEW
jgi:hypothetical protein